MRVQSDATGYIYGKTNTLARTLTAKSDVNYVIDGVPTTLNNEMQANIQVAGLLAGAATIKIRTTGGDINIPAMNNLAFTRPGIVINESRQTALPLNVSLAVPPINMTFRGGAPVAGAVVTHNPVETPIDFALNVPLQANTQGGGLNAQIVDCSGIACFALPVLGLGNGATLQNNFIQGSITNARANVTIQQDLGYVHSLPINSPFYLSLQAQDMRWPGTYSGANPEYTKVDGSTDLTKPATVTDVAKRGWWMSFADPINLGSVDPVQAVDIAPLFPQIAAQASAYLLANPATIGFGGLVNAITGAGDINVTVADPINLSSSPLSLTLRDLQLSGQNFTTNCYGGKSFC
jgi:hypothetical protein